MEISDLRAAPEFVAVVAERGWQAWWADSDLSLADYRSGIAQIARASGFPAALVAHGGARYLGSVLLIASDVDKRPQYSPWIAALWVEPEARRQGIAQALIAAARARARALGHGSCYLCADPALAPFYQNRGFRLIEADVEGMVILRI